ncbi:MAG: extracellular solute-binding protein [Oscillospiraceae bacterium]|nr:extracellular solute-binding protein [Oscillospiraceae bacterium]
MKKFLSFAISAAFAVQLCGCSDNAQSPSKEISSAGVSETSSVSAENTEATETSAENEIPPMDTSPINFTLFINDTNSGVSFDGEVAEEITARTGVTLEITAAEDENSLSEMLASGKIPDLIYAGSATDRQIESGLFIPLDGFTEKYGGNFSALYGDKLDRLRAADGKLYTFGTGGSSPARFTAGGTFQVRYSVLKELGYPEIKTIEQLGDCLRRYKELHPQSTGLLLCGAPIQQWTDTVSARVNYVLGYPDDGAFLVDNDTGETVYKWIDPRVKEYVRWLNGMYNDGVLDDMSFSLRHDGYIDRLVNGNAAAAADCYEDYSSAEDTLISSGRDDMAYCPVPAAFNEDTRVMFLADYGYAPAAGIGITTSCAEPERAFRFLDWWCGDEAQMLVNFGVSGEYGREADGAYFDEPFPMRGLTERNADGKFYSYAAEEYVSGYTESEKAAAEAYGITLFADMFPQESELPVIKRTLISDMDIPSLSETAILLETLDTYIKTEVPNAIKVSPEEFDAKWDEITDWCENNGAERLGEIMTKIVREDMRA